MSRPGKALGNTERAACVTNRRLVRERRKALLTGVSTGKRVWTAIQADVCNNSRPDRSCESQFIVLLSSSGRKPDMLVVEVLVKVLAEPMERNVRCRFALQR